MTDVNKKIISLCDIYTKDISEEEEVEEIIQLPSPIISKKKVNFQEPNINIQIQEIPKISIKKKPVSYEDILTSLNMKVVDGKLHYINKNAPPPNYNNINVPRPPPVTLTKEQYQQLVLENKRKRFIAQQRLRQVKSTKMLFSNNNNHTISVSANPTNLNKLFYFRK